MLIYYQARSLFFYYEKPEAFYLKAKQQVKKVPRFPENENII